MTKLRIMSTGRSGTAYLHEVAKRAGLDLGHEEMSSLGGVGWPLLWGEHSSDECLMLQYREPLACIASLATFNTQRWAKGVARVDAIAHYDNKLEQAARYWVGYNTRALRLINCMGGHVYDVASLPASPAAWKLALHATDFDAVPTDCNGRKHVEVTWGELDALGLAWQVRDCWRELWRAR